MGELANLRPDTYVPPQERGDEVENNIRQVEKELQETHTRLEELLSYKNNKDEAMISQLKARIILLETQKADFESQLMNIKNMKPETGSESLARIQAAINAQENV